MRNSCEFLVSSYKIKKINLETRNLKLATQILFMLKESKSDEKELEELKDKCEEYLNGWKRAQADYQNLEKEMSRRLGEMGQLATLGILVKFLPLIDNIARALSHVPQEDKDREWVNGFFQIQKQFTRILEELNIKKIAALGAKFDPHQHEAIGAKESEREEGIVLEEHESGYIWQDKVLRPAKVIVSK